MESLNQNVGTLINYSVLQTFFRYLLFLAVISRFPIRLIALFLVGIV